MKKGNKQKGKMLHQNAGRSRSKKKDNRRRMAAAIDALLPDGIDDRRTPGARQKLARHMGGTHTPRGNRRGDFTVEGIFHGTARGFGFVTPGQKDTPAGAEDIFIPAHLTGGAIDGDTVTAMCETYTAERNGVWVEKTEGRVVSLTPGDRRAFGTLSFIKSYAGKPRRMAVFYPDGGRLPSEIEIPMRDTGDAEDGDKVAVTLYRASGGYLLARVDEVFGPAEERGANYAAILAACNIRTDFPPPVCREAEEKAARPLLGDGREYPSDMIFTMDGADAKDLDDAVSLRRLPGGGWCLGVHIADVSEYVSPGSEIEKEAVLRGTSLYFTDKVVPMLPHALSSGACSLFAGEEKYALSAYMKLSPEGELVGTRVVRSIISSRVRGVYSEVNDVLANGKSSAFFQKYKAVYPALLRMEALYKILEKKATARGAMEFDRPEAAILLDADGEPCDILCRTRGVAEKMIEQFMLTANEGVATLMHEAGIPCVYRVHDKPEDGKLGAFLTYAHNMGLSVGDLSTEDCNGQKLVALFRRAEAVGVSRPLSYAMLRAMAKASYSDRPTGHFGLGIKLYCHFTSPIRRLSDLATHRILKAVLLDGETPGKYKSYARRMAGAASDCELKALEAEREIEALYKTLYLSRHTGEEWEASVSACTSFGLFCELPNTCEGFVPGEDLGPSYLFSEENMSISADGQVFRVGDPIRVRIEEADIPRRRVRFSLV